MAMVATLTDLTMTTAHTYTHANAVSSHSNMRTLLTTNAVYITAANAAATAIATTTTFCSDQRMM